MKINDAEKKNILGNFSVSYLKKICKENNIKGISSLKKNELVDYLTVNLPYEFWTNSKKIKGFGLHVFKKNNEIYEDIIDAISQYPDLKSVQIFSHGPRGTAKRKCNYAEVKKTIKKFNISLYIHSTYLTNPWNNNKFTMDHTLDQFRSSEAMGGIGVILHMPLVTADEISKKTLEIYRKLVELNIQQMIILEMKSSKPDPTKSYESPEKINRLIDSLANHGLNKDVVGICIDTAHIYAGKADIKSYDAASVYLNNIINKDWICLIHLNGNEYNNNERAGDKHAIPLDDKDCIWGRLDYDKSGCRAFVEFANLHDLDYIVEEKSHHTEKQIKDFLKKIIK